MSLFAYSRVATAPSPANSGLSLVVTSGEGQFFQQRQFQVPYEATIWPYGEEVRAENSEIVVVSGVSGDTITLRSRGTPRRTILVGDKIVAGASPFDDVDLQLKNLDVAGGGVASLVEGAGISVDATDPAHPIVSAQSGIQVATVHITGAQIATLNSVPVEVIAAPGAGKIICPVFVVREFKKATSTWTQDNATSDFGVLCYDVASPTLNAALIGSGFDAAAATAESCTWISPGLSIADGSSAYPMPNSIGVNAALVASADGDCTPSGTPDGDLYVTVYYTIVTLH